MCHISVNVAFINLLPESELTTMGIIHSLCTRISIVLLAIDDSVLKNLTSMITVKVECVIYNNYNNYSAHVHTQANTAKNRCYSTFS